MGGMLHWRDEGGVAEHCVYRHWKVGKKKAPGAAKFHVRVFLMVNKYMITTYNKKSMNPVDSI